MGFLKRFFSIGSKRSKKRSAVDPCTTYLPPVSGHLKPFPTDDTEAAVSRLLRSSSGRCTTEPQIGLDSLPPLPHPIDSVVPPPKSSSTTLASVSARSTYSVTIHGRTVHSRTEFPNAYPPMDVTFTPKRSLTDSTRRRSKSVPITPRDKNRLMALRQDPSVASLLNHYDDEGYLNSALFSNTPSPQKEGRVQRRRTGSTLRQLLGHPSSPELGNSSVEGDISWAEKFLGETDGKSSVSSIGPQTPADTHFTLAHSINDKAAFSIECDTSATDHPTFSSLEVELSVSSDHTHPQALSSPYGNSLSPKRASQIFGFLGDKKAALDGPTSRLPQLKTTTHYRHVSAESSTSDTKYSHIPLPRRCNTHIPQPTSPTSLRRYSLASDPRGSSPPPPTTVVSPSPQFVDEESADHPQPIVTRYTEQSNYGPRGPRPPSKIPSRQSTGPLSAPYEANEPYPVVEQFLPMQSVLGEKSNADNKHLGVTVVRPREMHSQIPKLRTASDSSAESKYDFATNSPCRHPVVLQPSVPGSTGTELPASIGPRGKENEVSRLPQPVTPVRLSVLHSHHLREVPSPASSSELSPLAKQMMANLRRQRMHARQRERQSGRLGSSQSRIRY